MTVQLVTQPMSALGDIGVVVIWTIIIADVWSRLRKRSRSKSAVARRKRELARVHESIAEATGLTVLQIGVASDAADAVFRQRITEMRRGNDARGQLH
jgi:hypothetical protein